MRRKPVLAWTPWFLTGVLALLSFIAACGPTLKQAHLSDRAVQTEKEKQLEIAFDTLIKRQKRLYDVSYPLLAAAASMNIDDARPASGFMICTKDAYPKEYREIAQRYFNLGDNPVIYYMHPQFPAAKVGVKPGDCLINYNGSVLIGKSFKEIKKIFQENRPPNEKQVTIVVNRDGQIMEFKMEGVLCCKYLVALLPMDQINAYSDGKNILVTSRLMRIAENDDELSYVVAHEIAHNVLGHVKKKRKCLIGKYI